MTYASIEASIFSGCSNICVEFSLKIVYNSVGYFKQGGCIFKFYSKVPKSVIRHDRGQYLISDF